MTSQSCYRHQVTGSPRAFAHYAIFFSCCSLFYYAYYMSKIISMFHIYQVSREGSKLFLLLLKFIADCVKLCCKQPLYAVSKRGICQPKVPGTWQVQWEKNFVEVSVLDWLFWFGWKPNYYPHTIAFFFLEPPQFLYQDSGRRWN